MRFPVGVFPSTASLVSHFLIRTGNAISKNINITLMGNKEIAMPSRVWINDCTDYTRNKLEVISGKPKFHNVVTYIGGLIGVL